MRIKNQKSKSKQTATSHLYEFDNLYTNNKNRKFIIIHTLPVSEFLPFLAGTVGKIVVFTAKRVGKVQCFIFYSTSNLPISFKFLQVFTNYDRRITL